MLIKKNKLFVLSIWVVDILQSIRYEVVLILERVIDVIAYHENILKKDIKSTYQNTYRLNKIHILPIIFLKKT